MRYSVAAPDLSGNELAYVTDCLRSTWISSNGRYIGEFEAGMAALTRTQHAIACANGTVALHLALLGVGLQPGDEVIVPSLTYVATANAVAYCGATPVFADCDPDTWCLSVQSVERLLTPRTRGIIPVHLYGHACDMNPLMELARQRGLWVVEDCAEALGANYRGKPVGSFGDCGVFSFFGNKIVTTGEGGMVVMNDDRLEASMRLLRGQGMSPNRRYWHPIIGYNYRMTNVAAAIGVAQLERVGLLLGHRRQLAGWYHERLGRSGALTLPVQRTPATNVYWMYSVLLDHADLRDPVMSELAERGIETRPFFYPVHEFPMYRNHPTDNGCPVATEVSSRGVCLPTSSYVQETDVDVIAGELEDTLRSLGRRTRQAA